MTPKPLRENPPPCVYCGLDSVSWTQVPQHVLCPQCQTGDPDNAFHVITVTRPVCLAHHPYPREVESEIKYQKAEEERERKIEAKRFLIDGLFNPAYDNFTISDLIDTAKKNWDTEIVEQARQELAQGNFELY